MGQLFAFFRHVGQRCGCPSDEQEKGSITMETIGTSQIPDSTVTNLEVTHLAQTNVPSSDSFNRNTVSDLKGTNRECMDLSHVTDPSNAETDGHLRLTDSQIDTGALTDSQIEGLAREMEARIMESIAIKDLGIGIETVNNLMVMRQGDYVAFNRDLLVLWRNKHLEINQVQRLADILYAAAEEKGLLDPHKVQQILKVHRTKRSMTTKTVIEEIITEAEFLAIAEKLKPHVERRMKIEPFPWLRDYYINMNKLYTELILEKIENELYGMSRRALKDYKEMFEFDEQHKILIKGDPGMGKTTLGKKMGWDWSRGNFRKFSIIFFVFLKFIKPRETIENLIIKQNPELEGLGVSAAKLHDILDRFGERCLLILDGLDEHGLGQNEDVLKIIRMQKLINCGIVVSSRPHSTRGIELNFTRSVRVAGFNREEAERFASNFFIDENKIRQVIDFRPSEQHSPVHNCPILLSFFCFLVAEQEIDLSDKTITMGDIYTRLVKSLYRKFTVRKGIEYKVVDFNSLMSSVGKLALRTLISNNPLLQKSEVVRVVGDCAFEYGLFAGHEDLRVLGDISADIYVTYPHRSLEEFFGSFGFIQALDDGKSVDDILGSDCKRPIFMVNPLVFRFFLWFLSTSDFDFPQKDDCYDKLTSYVAKRIDSKVFNPDLIQHEYPAIDMISAQLGHSQIQFFCDMLDKCKRMTRLHVGIYLPIERIHSNFVDNFFELMKRDLIDRMKTIIVGNDWFKLKEVSNNSLTLSIRSNDNDALEIMNLLLQKYNLAQRNPQIYMCIKVKSTACDITRFLSKYIKELDIFGDYDDSPSLTVSGEFSHCPILARLSIRGFRIDESVPSALSRAVESRKLPRLKRVTLGNCKGEVLRSDWPDKVKVSIW